jgi:hypothetical protein
MLIDTEVVLTGVIVFFLVDVSVRQAKRQVCASGSHGRRERVPPNLVIHGIKGDSELYPVG